MGVDWRITLIVVLIKQVIRRGWVHLAQAKTLMNQ